MMTISHFALADDYISLLERVRVVSCTEAALVWFGSRLVGKGHSAIRSGQRKRRGSRAETSC
jgi:hypothetical protein